MKEEIEDKWCHEERIPVMRCDVCDEPIYEGDTIYHINGEIWCEECIDLSKDIAGC